MRIGKRSTHGGRSGTGRDAVAWAQEAEVGGAGEILLTSMDRDGTGIGFDCELTRAVADSVRIPVIASGGAGGAQAFRGSIPRRPRRCRARGFDFSLRLQPTCETLSKTRLARGFR